MRTTTALVMGLVFVGGLPGLGQPADLAPERKCPRALLKRQIELCAPAVCSEADYLSVTKEEDGDVLFRVQKPITNFYSRRALSAYIISDVPTLAIGGYYLIHPEVSGDGTHIVLTATASSAAKRGFNIDLCIVYKKR